MIEFYWQVPQDGFEWQVTRRFEGREGSTLEEMEEGEYLVQRGIHQERRTIKNYHAFKKTGLFQTFAATEPDMEGILGFANLYGFLGMRVTVLQRIGEPRPGYPSSTLQPGELLQTWIAEIKLLHGAVRSWEKCRKIQPANRDGSIARAWDALQNTVNENMQRLGCSPRLLWERTARETRLRIRSVPQSLIAAMWVQFAMAIEGNRDYQQCDQCGGWFEVAAEKREDARFCSNACRFKAYRGRQKEAQRLRAEGKSLGQIAALVGSDVRTVSGWVRAKKGE